MSGYRTLHREKVFDDEAPIWQVHASSWSKASEEWSILTGSADGIVRLWRVREKDTVTLDDLDASALGISCTHALLGINQVFPPPSQTLVGCSQCQVIRNYVGDDDSAGDVVVIAIDFIGRIRVWSIPESDLRGNDTETAPRQLRCQHEVLVKAATGTLIAACPPNVSGPGDVTTAVACLDGSVAIVALGLVTPKAKNDAIPAGTVIDRWGSGATAMSLCWHPFQATLVVGRQDGLVEIVPSSKKGQHRLTHHSQPVRALAFTPDGQLLLSGSDDGFLAVWDVQRSEPTLVHHVVNAHAGWILNVCPLHDSRRFVTSGADEKVHVWQLDQMYAPLHTFHCDQSFWSMDTNDTKSQRLVGGSDKGWIQVFSTE